MLARGRVDDNRLPRARTVDLSNAETEPLQPLPSLRGPKVSHSLNLLNDSVSMIALDFDPSVFGRSASPKPGLQFGGKLREARLVQWQIRDDRHALAAPALRFSTHFDHGGFIRFLRLAGTGLFELLASWAEQFSPVVFSHC